MDLDLYALQAYHTSPRACLCPGNNVVEGRKWGDAISSPTLKPLFVEEYCFLRKKASLRKMLQEAKDLSRGVYRYPSYEGHAYRG